MNTETKKYSCFEINAMFTVTLNLSGTTTKQWITMVGVKVIM